MKLRKSPTQTDNPPDFAPGEYSADTARKYFDRGARHMVDSNRSFVIIIILSLIILSGIWTFNLLLPLKTVETFQVTRHDTGRLTADTEPVGKWYPDSDSVAYFLNQWGSKVFTINPSTITTTTKEASQMVVGSAVDQLRALRLKDNPFLLLKESPNLTRDYFHVSINFLKEDVALLRFRTVTRVAPGTEPKEVTYALTITFVRIKPSTREQVITNPGGLFVSNFNLSEEAVTK